jgi:DNA-binding CsgD family transcriptional regulator
MNSLDERTERLLALILIGSMKEAPQQMKIHKLRLAGFSNIEIADLLDISPTVVASLAYKAKKVKASNKAKSR